MQKRFLIIAVAMVSLCLGGVASAATATWTGDFSSDLMNQYNWSPEIVPTTGDLLNVEPGNYFDPVFAGTGETTTGSIFIDNGALVVVNSGTLRVTAPLADSGGLAVYNDSMDTPGLIINSGATFTSTQNVYIGGHGLGLGSVTVNEGGTLICHTLTIGYQSTELEGLLNVFGGTVNMGTLLRINPDYVVNRPCLGRIDVRNGATLPGVLFGSAVTGDYPISPAYVQELIDEGYIVSGPGYTPVVKLLDLNGVEVAFADANGITTQITAKQVYYATRPSPVASGSHQTFSAAQTLSWVKPLPRVPGDVVTSNVYFGTTNPPTTLVGTAGQADAFVTVSTVPQTTYHWKVDSFDPNGGVTIPTPAGAVWTFDTIIAPTVTAGYNGRQSAMRTSPTDPNSTAVLVATANDDGYPMALQYTWSAGTLDPNVTFSDPFALNPTATFNTPTVDYPLTLTVFDGAQLATATVTVKVFSAGDYCNAAKWPSTFSTLTGDMNVDCIVDAKDLAVLAAQWLVCNSPDCQ